MIEERTQRIEFCNCVSCLERFPKTLFVILWWMTQEETRNLNCNLYWRRFYNFIMLSLRSILCKTTSGNVVEITVTSYFFLFCLSDIDDSGVGCISVHCVRTYKLVNLSSNMKYVATPVGFTLLLPSCPNHRTL